MKTSRSTTSRAISRLFGVILSWFAVASCLAASTPEITHVGDVVALHNEAVRFEFDLSKGTYRILCKGRQHPAITQARMKINPWSSDDPAFKRSHKTRVADGPFGEELVLDLIFTAADKPELRFSVALHEGDFFSVTGGILNTGDKAIRVRDIHVMADAVVNEGGDMSRDFAMIDGFSGGEPLEYGQRSYSPLTRTNALKSRNNILLTFTDENTRRLLVMGGLTYQDFEKFATIAQARRTELELGRDGKNASLLDSTLSPVSKGPQVRRRYTAQLFASDPVGKRVDPKQLYIAADRFHIDVTGTDPFEALERYASRVRRAQKIDLSMYDFPTVCLWYAEDRR